MSHKSEIAIELKSKKHLLEALKALGFNYIEAKEGETLKTQGHYNQVAEVDILLTDQNSAVGFKQQKDGTYIAVGDFYGLQKNGRSFDKNTMKCEVTAHAKEAEVNDRLSALMFTMDSNTRKETNETISCSFQRWVD